MNHAEDIHELADLHGVKYNPNYRNHIAAREIMNAISDEIREKIIEKINECNYIGICLDDTTDRTASQFMAISIIYSKKGIIEQKFLKLIEIHRLDENNPNLEVDHKYLHSLVKSELEKSRLYKKLVAVSTDGASTMIGENSVTGMLRKELS